MRPEHTSGRYEQRAPRAYAVFSPVFRRRRTVTHAKPIPVNTPTNTQYIGTSPWVTTTIAIVMPGCGPAPPCATTVHQRSNPAPRPDRSAIRLANLAFSSRRKHRLRRQAHPCIHGNTTAFAEGARASLAEARPTGARTRRRKAAKSAENVVSDSTSAACGGALPVRRRRPARGSGRRSTDAPAARRRTGSGRCR